MNDSFFSFADLFIGRWDFVILSIILFVAFLAFLPFRKKVDWQAHGTYTAFIIALFAEMFGFPLTIYFVSSYFGQISFSSEFQNYMRQVGMPIGIAITAFGMVLVINGWKIIHTEKKRVRESKNLNDYNKSKEENQNRGIATSGIYRHVRHPQYLGFILITAGWLIHWPTIPTAIMFPILVVMYYKLAIREERNMENRFGKRYVDYKQEVPMFIPRLASSRS